MCKTLDVKLTPIPDWNCCGASIGYAGGGELSRHVMNARNFALAETHLPGQDIVATCAACWLGAREIEGEARRQRAAAGRHQRGAEGSRARTTRARREVRHMVEVLIEDFGYDELAQAGGEAARRHQVRRLRRLPDQPPVRHRRRVVREPEVPRQAGRDRRRRGRRPSTSRRSPAAAARWPSPSRRRARSRSRTSSSRPTTTAPT